MEVGVWLVYAVFSLLRVEGRKEGGRGERCIIKSLFSRWMEVGGSWVSERGIRRWVAIYCKRQRYESCEMRKDGPLACGLSGVNL